MSFGGRGGFGRGGAFQSGQQPQQMSGGDGQSSQQWMTSTGGASGSLPPSQSRSGGGDGFGQFRGGRGATAIPQQRADGFFSSQPQSHQRQSQSGGADDIWRQMSAVNLGGDAHELQGPKPQPSKHVPTARTLEQLYMEDNQKASYYSRITEDDAEIEIQGRGGAPVIIE